MSVKTHKQEHVEGGTPYLKQTADTVTVETGLRVNPQPLHFKLKRRAGGKGRSSNQPSWKKEALLEQLDLLTLYF